MNRPAFLRSAMVVALIGFFLPWLLVQCSGQTVLEANGFALAAGQFDARDPINGSVQHQSAPPNLLIAAALALVVIGIPITSRSAVRKYARRVGWMAASAIACSALGLNASIRSLLTSPQAARATGGLLSHKIEWGFGITILALLAASLVGLATPAPANEQSTKEKAPDAT